MPGLRSREDNNNNEDEEDYTYTKNKGFPGVTTCSGRVVKQPENFKDDDYSYNQLGFGNFAFSGSQKEKRFKCCHMRMKLQIISNCLLLLKVVMTT